MSYTIDEICTAQKIFQHLLEKHEIDEKKESSLYMEYVNNENIKVILDSQAQVSNVSIQRYGDVIYLVPNFDNTFLGFSKTELRQKLCRGNSTETDYHLANFTILVLLNAFYDGHGTSSKFRDYIRFGELQNLISDYLKYGMNRYSEEEQNAGGLLFTKMYQIYESLRSDEKITRQKTTKEGFLYNILNFLDDQGLVEFVEQEERIQTTQKLDYFMDWNILNKNNYEQLLQLLKPLETEIANSMQIDNDSEELT